MPGERGVRVWSSAEWLDEATDWIDRGLSANGLARDGDVEQTRVRPWATVVRVPTNAEPVWFKAAAEATAFEVPLYEVLVETHPDWVLTPLAADADRGWLLLPDGGPTLGDRTDEATGARELADVLAAYGRFQRSLSDQVERMLASGVPDMRPERMPERLGQAIALVESEPLDAAAEEAMQRVRRLTPQVDEWAARLVASPLAASLDHNDLHPWNVLGASGDPRLYDWGDSVVAHPLASALVPLGFMNGLLDPRDFEMACDGYLQAFSDVAPLDVLREELEAACRLAKISRSLTWERATRASREDGEEVEARFAQASLRTLTALLADDWLSLA